MEPLITATVIARMLQFAFGMLLSLPAFYFARRRAWTLSAIAAPIALIITMHVGGLLLTVPSAVAMMAVYYVFSILTEKRSRSAIALRLTIGLIILLWTIAQIVHLPIRLYLAQDSARIAGNVAGIALAIALTSCFVESGMKRTACE